jgi:hypothetical protein
MAETAYTGSSLEQALKSGTLEKPAIELVGMVKASEKANHISFARGDCETWIDLPTNLIDHAEHVGQRSCRDHVHPVCKVTLKEPKDPTAQILSSLLATSMPSQPLTGTLPALGRRPSVTQAAPEFRHSAVPRHPGVYGNPMLGSSSSAPNPTARMSRQYRQPGFPNFPGSGNVGAWGEWGCWDTTCCELWGTCCLPTPYGEQCWTCCIWEEPCERCIWPW